MNKPRNYEETQSFGGFEPLVPGAYVCKVIGVTEINSRNGKPMTKIAIDIAEGDESGRFKRLFENDTRTDKKWSNQAVIYQLILDNEGNCSSGFKTFVETVENDNNTKAVWGDGFCNWAKGKYIGVVFRREEYENQNGERKWTTKPFRFCASQDVRDGKISAPKDKPLSGTSVTQAPIPHGFAELDEEIPF